MRLVTKLLVFTIMAFLLLVPNYAWAAPSDNAGTNSGTDRILVKFRSNVSATEIAQIHRQYGGQVKEDIPGIKVQVVTVPIGKAAGKISSYSSDPRVLYAEPDYVSQAVLTPSDTYFSQQWGMQKVEAPSAWDVTKGSSNIKIAILDTGVDPNHPDLVGKIVGSINFSGSATVNDVYGHGTHVAGIAAASTNNGVGVAGLGYSSSILNVKVLGDDSYGYYSWIASGIIWASDNGAQVINMSLGGTSPSSTLQDAVNYAWNKGAVVVAAAGNNGSSAPFYPAYYDNAIAVAATDVNDNLPSWSDYGDWVDVAAPGVSIYSTLINGGYGYKSGTSMATPYTSGLAALLYSVVTDSNGNGRLNDEVRMRIQSTADPLTNTGAGSGRINAYKAVGLYATPSGNISGMVTDSSGGSPIGGATVSWSAGLTTTDATGNYAISGLAAGSYQLTATKDGYQTSSSSINVISGQTTSADFALTKLPTIVTPMWVPSIVFTPKGKNLGINVSVSAATSVVFGANVAISVTSSSGKRWDFNGTTGSNGVASFVVPKAPAGDYLATVVTLTASGYSWDTSSGITFASCTLSAAGKATSHN